MSTKTKTFTRKAVKNAAKHVLRNAEYKLRHNGTVRGTLGGPDCGYCLVGAISAAVITVVYKENVQSFLDRRNDGYGIYPTDFVYDFQSGGQKNTFAAEVTKEALARAYAKVRGVSLRQARLHLPGHHENTLVDLHDTGSIEGRDIVAWTDAKAQVKSCDILRRAAFDA